MMAFESVEALLAGYTSKPSHAVFSYPVATAAFGARSVQQQGGGNTWGEPALHPAHSPGQLRHNLPSACGEIPFEERKAFFIRRTWIGAARCDTVPCHQLPWLLPD
ncbi:hypothetical protein HaLaN_26091 [Haematococcus lacustris]|uniref:Uncharacterized protein n=1 Tax=Haematococcus lacustris TaxID=44745 RepID=A0A6A0A5E3_HAELA|nr:hypothetical protein HaLaN_26091 [Haematococcus lacustris]